VVTGVKLKSRASSLSLAGSGRDDRGDTETNWDADLYLVSLRWKQVTKEYKRSLSGKSGQSRCLPPDTEGGIPPMRIKTLLLVLWVVLVSHRAFLPRSESLDLQSSYYDTLVFIEIGITTLIFVVSCILVVFHVHTMTFNRIHLILWLYIVTVAMSVIWSPHPTYGTFWVMRLFSAIAIVTLYFHKATPAMIYRFLDCTILALVPHLLLPLFALRVGLQPTPDMRIKGLWLQPVTGSIIAFAIFIISVVIITDKEWRYNFLWLLIALLSLVSGLLFGGKTGVFAGSVTMGVYLLTRPRLTRVVRFFSLLGIVLIGFRLYNIEYGLFAHLIYYEQKVQFGTIKDRFSLWISALQLWIQSPWSLIFGHGYTSTRVNLIPVYDAGWFTTHAHNSFLQSLVEVGIIGSLPLFWFIWKLVVNALCVILWKQNQDCRLLAWSFAVLHLIISSVMDNVFGGLIYGPFYLLLAGGMSLLYLSKNENHRGALASKP